MGFLKGRRKEGGELPTRQKEIIQLLHPHFQDSRNLKGDPGKSIAVLTLFASCHEKPFDDLTDAEVSDFIDVLKGIDRLVHPDEMKQAGKLRCSSCQVAYMDLWKVVTQPVIDRVESGAPAPELTPELARELSQRVIERERFLSE
jgi:hypothetical protein